MNQQRYIETVMQGVQELFAKERQQHGGEKSYSVCRIQEGYHDYLRIVCKTDQIQYFLYDFSWSRTPDHAIKGLELEKDVSYEILPQMAEVIRKFFLEAANQPLFAYKLRLVIEWENTEKSPEKGEAYCQQFDFEDEVRKLELRKKMETYIQEVLYEERRPFKDTREISIFRKHLLDFSLMDYSLLRVIEIIERGLQITQNIKNRRWRTEFCNGILHEMDCWVKKQFLPLYCEVISNGYRNEYPLRPDFSVYPVDAEKLELYVYAAVFRIQHGSMSYDASFGRKELERAAKEFGSKKAQQYLKTGTGKLADTIIHWQTTEMEGKANDVFTTIQINIKEEVAEAYKQALDFIMQLLQQGFPRSYQIKLTSKADKKFLPIKGIANSQTHRFFAHALQFEELYPKLEAYAQLAMKEFEWYEDVEAGEKSCMPGSYAVFGLGLYSEHYFPLVMKYFELLDDEHQMVHRHFVSALIDRYGVTERSLPVICAGIISARFDKVFKNLGNFLTQEENSALLDFELRNRNDHEQTEILQAIWGKDGQKKWKQVKNKKNKREADR